MKVALACTGGGTKASVNIGVIRALQELNIEIEAISGSSIGAVVAFLYICGYSPKEMLEVLENIIHKDGKYSIFEKIIAVPRLIIKAGGKKIKYTNKYIEKIEKDNNIENMNSIDIPFIIPVLDVSKREIAYYSSKELKSSTKCYCNRKVSEAIKGSMALPIFFQPNKVIIDNENHFITDGGILTNTLITPLKEYSDFVIGVSNKFYPKYRKRVNIFTGFVQTFQSMRRAYFKTEIEKADLWIECDIGTNNFNEKCGKMKVYEEIGYQATMKAFKEQKILNKE